MTKALMVAAIALSITACGRPEGAEGVDDRIVCNLDGQAFNVRPYHQGGLSRVIRLAEADVMCSKEAQ